MSHPWWQDKVACQIYPRSFLDSNGDGTGDLPGIRSKLDYLQDLGIDILWFSPIYPSPMVDQGYDIADYYGVDPRFGTLADLDALIADLHQRNMHLILDLVVNHCSDQHPWFQAAIRDPDGPYGQFFYLRPGRNGGPPNNWRAVFGGSCWDRLPGSDLYYFHSFAREQPDLNWENPAVREEIYTMVNWWLDRGISGFRIDAITNLKKNLDFPDGPPDSPDGTCAAGSMLPQNQEIGVFLNELKTRCFLPHNAFTVGEVCDVPRARIPEFAGSDGYFSTCFDFAPTRTDIHGPYWYQRTPLRFADWRAAMLDQPAFLANILENHDQPRGASYFIPEEDYGFYSVTALAAVSLLLRGIPFLYQGQEIGMRNGHFQRIEDFEDVSTLHQYDAALAAGLSPADALTICNRYSRDNARTPIPWTDGPNGGFTTGTPWFPLSPDYLQINVARDAAAPQSIRAFYKKLIALRKAYPDILAYGSMEPAFQEIDHLFAYYRIGESSGKRILVLSNFQQAETSVPFQPDFQLLLNNHTALDLRDGQLHLAGYQTVVLLES